MDKFNLTDALKNFDEEEECDFIPIEEFQPYLDREFKTWLVSERVLSEKSANEYLINCRNAYYSLYDLVEIDLAKLLQAYLTDIPDKTGSDFSREASIELVNIYLETMQEELDQDEDSYSKAELRAMLAYHDFIVDYTDAPDLKCLKEKCVPLPDKDDFLSWLEKEYKMEYEKAVKIISSVSRMGVVLPSLVTDPMSFLDVLRALPSKGKRENYLAMISGKIREKHVTGDCSKKTVQNGISNIRYYNNFLNQKN